MSHLCFGSFASILHDCSSLTKEGLVDLLLDAFEENSSESIDKSDKNKFINSKKELPRYIRDKVGTPKTDKETLAYFESIIYPIIKTVKQHELLSRTTGIIQGDCSITVKDKECLLSAASIEKPALFLSRTFIFACSRSNISIFEAVEDMVTEYSVLTITNGNMYLNGELLTFPKQLAPPTNLAQEEAVYITELLRAYADAEQVNEFSIESLPSNYQRHFTEQRQNYFNAEAIGRFVRDTGISGQFDMFLDDTYDSISDVCYKSYSDGYQRLLSVLQQAANRPQGKSVLERMLTWIGSSEKKGACHILVNQKRITWVTTNE